MLDVKRGGIETSKETYENGVAKLKETAEVVGELEALLKVKTVEVEQKKAEAEEIETVVGGEKTIVEAENEKAQTEAVNCDKIAVRADAIAKSAKTDLDKAIPLVEETKKQLEGLDEKAFGIIKSFAKPPEPVEKVLFACMCLLASVDPNVQVHKKGKPQLEWKTAKIMIANPKGFKATLGEFAGMVEEFKVPHQNFKAAKE